MAGYRMDRLTEDIARELSDIIRNMKDPRAGGIISIVHVEVSPDLSLAKVHVSSLGGGSGAQDGEATTKALNGAAGFIRRELSRRLSIRKTPALKFIADDSIEQSVRISKIINDLSKRENEQ